MYTELIIQDKQKYLNENYPFEGTPKLTDRFECIHCYSKITVGDYKVYKYPDSDFEYICCPNAPECNGTVIDWVESRRARRKRLASIKNLETP